MKTIKLTKKDFNDNNEFIGDKSILDHNGHLEIDESLGYVKFDHLNIRGYIYAKAGSGIKAGEGIKAGWGIEAGLGIKAGLSVSCKTILNIGLRIFAGLCLWKTPSDEEMEIRCGKLEHGEVCYGNLIEEGIKEEKKDNCDGKVVEIDGKEYKLSLIKEESK